MKHIAKAVDLSDLTDLVHHRWNVPVLALLATTSGAKFVTMANSLKVSRASLSASLKDLIESELVVRNAGHGHPMRPEYLLTKEGSRVAQHCLALHKLVKRGGAQAIAYRKWTLPLVAAIGGDVRRFNEVRSLLPVATPRAITMGLKSLVEARWATRTIIDDYPPTAGYRLQPPGQRILSSVQALL